MKHGPKPNLTLSNAAANTLQRHGVLLTNSAGDYRHGTITLGNGSLMQESSYIEQLTSYGIGYATAANNRLKDLRDHIAPTRKSNSRYARLVQWDESEPFYTVDYNKVKRALLAEPQEVRQLNATVTDRFVPNRALTVYLDVDQLKDRPELAEIHTKWLIDLLMRASIVESLALISASAVQMSTVWDGAANPDLEIKSLLLTTANVTGFYPKTSLYGDAAALKRQASYENQLTAGSLAHSQMMTEQQIAVATGVEDTFVNADRYASGSGAKTEFVGQNVILYTAVQEESPEDPSNVVRHVANGAQGGGEYAVFQTQLGAKKMALTVENFELMALQHSSGILEYAIN